MMKKTIKTLALVLSAAVLLVLLVFSAAAEEPQVVDSGTCGSNLTWTLDSEGTLTISGEGYMRGFSTTSYTQENNTYYRTSAPWGAYHRTIQTVEIGDGVTSIGEYAFYYCTSLTSVTIGDGVTSIGEFAFHNCTSLTSVTIGDSVTSIGASAFYNCSSLTSVTIGDSVTSIGNSAFYECRSLASVTIGSSVTNIGHSAFYHCDSLISIVIPDSVTLLGANNTNSSSGVFYNCDKLKTVVIGNSLTAINPNTFYSCDALESVTVGAGVTSIGNSAFYNCNSLKRINISDLPAWLGISGLSNLMSYGNSQKELYLNGELLQEAVIPDGVTSIGAAAFRGCSGLTSVSIPDSVTHIGASAFQYCSGLTSVTIGDGVTSIGASAFYNCSSLTSVSIPDSVTSIGSSAFSGCSSLTGVTIPDGVTSIGASAFSGCSSLTSVTIPDGVTSIGDSAFYNCDSLESIVIPDSVTTMGTNNSNASYGVFYDCDKLKTVVIGNGLTAINPKTFYSCDALESVTVGAGVTSIGASAFYNCSSLTSVTIGDGVTSIGASAFYNCSSLTSVTIPDSVTSIGDSAFYGCYIAMLCCSQDSYALQWAQSNGFPYYMTDAETEEENIIAETVNKKLSYTIDKAARTLTVYNDGSMVTFSSTDAPWKQYVRYVLHIVVADGCTTISERAFYEMQYAQTVDLPDGLTEIKAYAFFNCYALDSLVLPEGLKSIGYAAFRSCSKLKDLSMQNGVTTIYDYAFYSCSSLTGVTIPDSVTSIGSYAFCNCTALKAIDLPQTLRSIGYYTFSGCIRLSSIVIPDSVTSIGSDVFNYCTGLKSVTIGEGLSVIYINTFYNCSSLTDVIIGGHVNTIRNEAFYGCTSLEKIVLPESVKYIDTAAFSGTGLRKIYIRAMNCTIYQDAIYYRATIYGYRGGTVEAFADQYGYDFVALDAGDHDHEFSEWEPHPAATCTEDGVLLRRCEICGEREEEVLPALGHDYSETVIAPTCTVTGYTTHVCARCGNRYDDAFTDALGHDWQQGDTVEPGCETDGYTMYACARCGAAKAEDQEPALGHDWQQGDTVAPTCTAEGYTVYTCTRCGGELWQDFTPMTPHVDEDDDGLCDVCEKRLQYRITENQTIRVAITGGQLTYIRFIPALPGVATITSVSNEDTYGYLFNANMNQIASNDDGGSGNNFLLTRRMNAGEVYYIGVRYFNSGRSGSFEVRVDYKIDCKHETTEPIPAVEPTCEDFGYTEGVRCAVCGEVLEGQTPVEPLNHDFAEVSRKEPTETETGFIKYACSRCGVTMQKKLPALGHDWQLLEEAEPTCETDGYKLYQCAYEDCDETLRETIPALGHTYGEWVVTKEPTCHAVGMTMSACTRCELAKAQYLPMLEHVVATDAAVEPTCTSVGWSEGSHCLLCGDVFTAQEMLPMLPHTEEYVDEIPATCVKDGVAAGVRCTACDQELSGFETIPALGHLAVTEDGFPATCTENGRTDRTYCERCGMVFQEAQEIPAFGHSYQISDERKETCEEDGYTTYTCTRCGDTYTEEYPARGHALLEKVVAPTCENAGFTEYYCTKCTYSYRENETDPLGHDYEETGSVMPTCEKDGCTVYTCSRCKGTLNQSIPALGHDYENASACPKGEGVHALICNRCAQTGYPPVPCVDTDQNAVCDLCGQLLAHTHVFTNYVPDGNATCIADGTKTATCDLCGKAKDTVADEGSRFSASHEYEWTDMKDATCIANSHRRGVCRLCGAVTLEEIADSALGHNASDWLYPEGFDCEVGGNRWKTCTRCNQVIMVEPVEGRAHSAVIDPEVPKTCTVDGRSAGSHCDICGKILTPQIIFPAEGHKADSNGFTVLRNPACTTSGAEYARCGACGEIFTRTVPALGHVDADNNNRCDRCGVDLSSVSTHDGDHVFNNQPDIAAVAPTCTESGHGYGWTCKYPGCRYVMWEADKQTIPALGHVGGTATCTAKAVCTRCKQEYGEIDANRHTLVHVAATAPTCVDAGCGEYWKCSGCGKCFEDSAGKKLVAESTLVLPADGKSHSLKKIPAKAATCAEAGNTEYWQCERCSCCYSDAAATQKISQADTIVARLAHTWGKLTLKEGNCAIGGKGTHQCTVCATVEDVTILAGQHPNEARKTIPAVAATCTEPGRTEQIVCGLCGIVIQPANDIPARGHDYAVTAETAAGCETAGETVCVCRICGDKHKESIPALGHTDDGNDGYCDRCGEQMQGGDHCKYCGQIHGGAFGWLTKFFHSILAVFKR